ncbi:hypothetical protein [Gracilibacillus salitolerans]|uniref:hypothetical protein n=1 Tax=Gracilibacillus salitolerans TaxID=2663022 RepID=UPI001891705C|nr:hypothetical protein [Gracilibacillus salitolerans]
MRYYYNPEVKYLLMSESLKKANLIYDNNPSSWKLPTIGLRPPYYANPKYKPYYPTI